MTSSSSSVASPAAFSPSFDNATFDSPSAQWSGNVKEEDRVFASSAAYSPSNTRGLFQSHSSTPVVEPSITESSTEGSSGAKAHESSQELLNPAHFDSSGTSNSSSETVSGSLAGLTKHATPEEQSGRTERSSSSSSSSSSLLSERPTSKDAYETPLTASLPQDEPPKRMSDAPGYPFPSVAQQTHKIGSKSTKQNTHDLWKHTDDLLAPSGKVQQQAALSQKSSSAKGSPSTLSLSKPSPTESSTQNVSASQTTTPTVAEMDRRDSQSSSISSGSVTHSKSKSPLLGQGTIALPSHSASPGNSTKLSTSSSPATSSGFAGFSPLNALVEPFSPSSNPAGLPSKLNAGTQGATTPGASSSDRKGRTQTNVPTQSTSFNSASQNVYADQASRPPTSQRGERVLEGSTTSSSGDTGYFSNVPQSAAYAHSYRAGPPSAASAETLLGTRMDRLLFLTSQPPERRRSRLCAYSLNLLPLCIVQSADP